MLKLLVRMLPAAALGVVALATVLAGTRPAAAQTPNGATPYRSSSCTTDTFITICHSIQAVSNSTSTPLGNHSFVWNYSTCTTQTRNATGAVEFHSCERYNYHIVRTSDDIDRVEHVNNTRTFLLNGQTCTTVYRSQFAAGQVRHFDASMTCS